MEKYPVYPAASREQVFGTTLRAQARLMLIGHLFRAQTMNLAQRRLRPVG